MYRTKSLAITASMFNGISELEVKAVRRVRTPAGVKRYGQPIGSIIIGGGKGSPLKNLTLQDSEYAGLDKVKTSKGKTFYVGKYDGDDQFTVNTPEDDLVHSADTLEDAFRWLDTNPTGAAADGSGEGTKIPDGWKVRDDDEDIMTTSRGVYRADIIKTVSGKHSVVYYARNRRQTVDGKGFENFDDQESAVERAEKTLDGWSRADEAKRVLTPRESGQPDPKLAHEGGLPSKVAHERTYELFKSGGRSGARMSPARTSIDSILQGKRGSVTEDDKKAVRFLASDDREALAEKLNAYIKGNPDNLPKAIIDQLQEMLPGPATPETLDFGVRTSRGGGFKRYEDLTLEEAEDAMERLQNAVSRGNAGSPGDVNIRMRGLKKAIERGKANGESSSRQITKLPRSEALASPQYARLRRRYDDAEATVLSRAHIYRPAQQRRMLRSNPTLQAIRKDMEALGVKLPASGTPPRLTTNTKADHMELHYKSVPISGVKDEGSGMVDAIVAVTGLKDNVNDIILPGAFAKSLGKRTPKGVWHHNIHETIARTLDIKELLPGDPDLPKSLADGTPWPESAGALMVKMKFNDGTQRGRDAYADVKFYGTDQEWSIGYSVPTGGATLDKKGGVRLINTLDLFEYSPVLFGAMPNARTVSVKSAQEAHKVVLGLNTPECMEIKEWLSDMVMQETKAQKKPHDDEEDDFQDSEDMEDDDLGDEGEDGVDSDWWDDETPDEDEDKPFKKRGKKSIVLNADGIDALDNVITQLKSLYAAIIREVKEGASEDDDSAAKKGGNDTLAALVDAAGVDANDAAKAFDKAMGAEDTDGMEEAASTVLDAVEAAKKEDDSDVTALKRITSFIAAALEDVAGDDDTDDQGTDKTSEGSEDSEEDKDKKNSKKADVLILDKKSLFAEFGITTN